MIRHTIKVDLADYELAPISVLMNQDDTERILRMSKFEECDKAHSCVNLIHAIYDMQEQGFKLTRNVSVEDDGDINVIECISVKLEKVK